MLRRIFFFLILLIPTIVFTQNHVEGEVLIQFDQDKGPNDLEWRNTPPLHVKKLKTPYNIYLLHFDPGIPLEEIIQSLQSHTYVRVAQKNHKVYYRDTFPNDSQFFNQWSHRNLGQTGGAAGSDMNSTKAWDITTGGHLADSTEIVVCVIDDGTSLHEDLVDNLWINSAEIPNNFIDDDNNGYIDDYYGWAAFSNSGNVLNGWHGVQVNGVLGAQGNNSTGIAGVNWNVRIMNVSDFNLTEASVIEAYSYPLYWRKLWNETNGAEGAFVVATNSSWGLDGADASEAPLWCAFYDSLGHEGILSVAATANIGWDIDVEGDLPTQCSSDFLISVTATNHMDMRTFSAYGAESVDLGAPGENVLTTSPFNGYNEVSGTSFASPITAGAIALLYSLPEESIKQSALIAPAATALFVKEAIFEGTDPIQELQGITVTGGRLNLYNALRNFQMIFAQCLPPIVDITVQNHNEAFLSLFTIDSVLQVDLRYRLVDSSSSWDTISNVGDTVFLTELLYCSEYEIEAFTTCIEDTIPWTLIGSFNTTGCCEAPEILDLTIEDDLVDITWNGSVTAPFYTLTLENLSDSTVEELAVSDTSLMIMLDSCRLYNLNINAQCNVGGDTSSRNVMLFPENCSPCSDTPYCMPSGSNNTLWVEEIRLRDHFFKSGKNNGGFNFFPGFGSFELIQNRNYLLTIVKGGNYPLESHYAAYLDLNRDTSFSDMELLFRGTAQDTLIDTFFIPPLAEEGYARLRIIQSRDSITGPCQEGGVGEVEDYCIYISDRTDCPKVEITAVDSTFNSLDIQWDSVITGIAYNIRYREAFSGNEWTIRNSFDTFYMIPELKKCTDYEVQIRSVCMADTSNYEPGLLLRTQCDVAIDEVTAGLDVHIYPNPFKDYLTIAFYNDMKSDYEVLIADLQGRIVFQESLSNLPAGNQRITLNNLKEKLSSSVYLLNIKNEKAVFSTRLIKH